MATRRAFPALRTALQPMIAKPTSETAAKIKRRLEAAERLAARRLEALRRLAKKLRACRGSLRESNAEVDRLRAQTGRLEAEVANLTQENARLAAEVEHLRSREPSRATGPVGGLLARLGKAKEGGDE